MRLGFKLTALMAVPASVVLAVPAYADLDPHVPNVHEGHCPGGHFNTSMSESCDGTPFPNGAFLRETITYIPDGMKVNPPAAGALSPGVHCLIPVHPGAVQFTEAPPGSCG